MRDLAVAWPNERFAIAAITASELLYGVKRANTEQRRKERQDYVETILDVLPVIPFDLALARVHADIGASLAAIGRPIGSNDLNIATTAIALGYDVVTEHVREFDLVRGSTVRRPSW